MAESIWWKDLDADPNVPKMPVTIEDVLLFGVAVIEPENPERQAIVNEGQFTYGFIRYSEIYTDDAGQRMGREIHIRVIPE